jgi:hypothetical protein
MTRRFALVQFTCDAHVGAQGGGRRSGTLTVHQGKWAFCPASRITAHRWIATGGVKIGQLVDLGARR